MSTYKIGGNSELKGVEQLDTGLAPGTGQVFHGRFGPNSGIYTLVSALLQAR